MVLLPLVLCCALLGSTGVHAAGGSTQYAQAQRQASEGHYTAAVHAYEQAILQGHNDPYTYWRLGLAYGKVKRWDDALWALATALSDNNFAAAYPQAQKDLMSASAAGGVNVGPPPNMRSAGVSPAPPAQANTDQVAAIAVKEAQAAFTALQTEAFFVSPGWNTRITPATVGMLSETAKSLDDASSTTVKFAYLGVLPPPYTTLASFTKDFFSHLKLQQAVLVIVMPDAVSVYSDRVNVATAQHIADGQFRKLTLRDPVGLAVAVAHAVTNRADANAADATHLSLLIGVGVILAILAIVTLAVRAVMRNDGSLTRGRSAKRARLAGIR